MGTVSVFPAQLPGDDRGEEGLRAAEDKAREWCYGQRYWNWRLSDSQQKQEKQTNHAI